MGGQCLQKENLGGQLPSLGSEYALCTTEDNDPRQRADMWKYADRVVSVGHSVRYTDSRRRNNWGRSGS